MSTRFRRLWEKFIKGNPTACRLWRDDPAAFWEWAEANGYDDGKLLLRYHKGQGYTPENCHWSDRKNRGQGRRAKHYITLDGETRSAAEWSRVTGIPYETIRGRICSGKAPEEILQHETLTRAPGKPGAFVIPFHEKGGDQWQQA